MGNKSAYVAIKIKDMNDAGGWPSTSAKVEIRKKQSTIWTLIVTILPAKLAAVEFWTYPVALPAATYKFTAIDMSVSPHICEEKIVVLHDGDGIELVFDNLVPCPGCA